MTFSDGALLTAADYSTLIELSLYPLFLAFSFKILISLVRTSR